MRTPAACLGLLFLGVLLALSALGVRAQEGLRYPRDLAWRLVTEKEIQEHSGCPQELGQEQQEADPLFDAPQAPLGAIAALPDKEPVLLTPRSSTWEVAPFPSLEPPPPRDLPPEALKSWQDKQARVAPEGQRPVTFADISTETSEAPAAALRPRPTLMGQQLLAPASELPRPFSLRRYHTRDRGFFQVALYGGSSGLGAERDYHTLRAAAPNRKVVDGVGEEAFLSLLPRAPAPAPEPSPAAQSAFQEITPLGEVRLDLVDEGLIKASQAPSFQTIPVDLGLPEGLKKDRSQPEPEGTEDPLAPPDPDPFGGSVSSGEGGVQVLVAFFPAKGLVLEMAMDDRVGDTQALLRLAFLAQARLLQRW